jgi:SLT domain-containing protein
MSIGVDGQRKAMAMRMARSAYPLATTEVAARTRGRHDQGEGKMTAQRFYLTNGDRRDDVWLPGG